MTELHRIFPTIILTNTVDSGIADKVENLFLERVQDLPANHEQYSDYSSEENKIFDVKIDLPELFDCILLAKDEFVAATGINTTPNEFEMWTQDYRFKRQGHARHNHGVGISGVYWIRTDENASPLVFHHPNPVIKLIPKKKETEFSYDTANCIPARGKLVLFPSWLDHEVPASLHDGVRSCISFNFPLLTHK